MGFWKDKRVLVAGGTGFIGSHVVERLLSLGAQVRVADNMENGDLANLEGVFDDIEWIQDDLREPECCQRTVSGTEVVLNLGARVGGIAYNLSHQGIMFRDNALLGIQLLEAARKEGVQRYLVVSSACVYPRDCLIPTPESEGFVREPEPTNLGYGWAKRFAEVAARMYHEEFGMSIAIARPYNAYGPRDHFDEEKAHVIPALIRRVFGGENPVVVWGDGDQTRSFLYVEDLAEGLLRLAEHCSEPDPVNLGTEEEVTIRELVERLIQISGRELEIRFDPSKPAGQPRRNCDTTKARERCGFHARTPLAEGLQRTVEWYLTQTALKR